MGLNGVEIPKEQDQDQNQNESLSLVTEALRKVQQLVKEASLVQMGSISTSLSTNPEWLTLYQGDGVRLGLIVIPEQTPVSFHDHPNTLGVMLLLSGNVSVLSCSQVAKINARGAMLEVNSEREFGPDETVCVTPGRGNIHRLQSLTECSIAIDLLVEGQDSIPRNWYFPLDSHRTYRPGERFPTTVLTDWRGVR